MDELTKKTDRLVGQWLREEEITRQFAGIYRSVEIPPEVVEDILSSLKASHQGKIDLYEATRAGLEAQHQQLEKRVERMYEDRLDGRNRVQSLKTT